MTIPEISSSRLCMLIDSVPVPSMVWTLSSGLHSVLGKGKELNRTVIGRCADGSLGSVCAGFKPALQRRKGMGIFTIKCLPKQKDIFHLLVHSTMVEKSGWARARPESWNSIQISHMAKRNVKDLANICCHPSHCSSALDSK